MTEIIIMEVFGSYVDRDRGNVIHVCFRQVIGELPSLLLWFLVPSEPKKCIN